MPRPRTNPHRKPDPSAALEAAGDDHPADRRALHRALPSFAPTPLVRLPGLAARLGIGELLVKDESRRLELGAFKVLGASYAMARRLEEARREAGESPRSLAALLEDPAPANPRTFAAATDGNHGRAVAWAARALGHRATIYIPAHAAPARVQHLRDQGARVELVDGSYDETVARCAADSASQGWWLLADTAWDDYRAVPRWVVAGYQTMFDEVAEQRGAAGLAEPDVAFLQCGVGSLAAAGARAFPGESPRLVCVEPEGAACAYESVAAGTARSATGSLETIMAGLNCGTLSATAWPALRDRVDLFLALEDRWAEEAVRHLWHPVDQDPRIESGESGAAGLAGLLALHAEPEAWAAAGLGPESTVLVLNTEGATDPENWRALVATEPR